MEPPSSIDPLPELLTPAYLVGFSVLILLLLLSALLSGAETAFYSMSSDDVNRLKSNNDKSSIRVVRLLSTPDYLISTILLLNTLINVSFILLSAYMVAQLGGAGNTVEGFLILMVLISLVLLLFGEAIPKFVAANSKIPFLRMASFPLMLGMNIAKPFSKLIISIVGKISKPSLSKSKSDMSIEDLSDAINVTKSHSDEDKQLLRSIVDLGSTDVNEVMHSRIDISAVDISISFDELYAYVVDCGYSRIPVFEGDLDNIKGVLYIKDLLPHLNKNEVGFSWQSLIRPAYFVPESKRVNDLLREFQQKRIHMAIVVDEYGGTSGIVTLEDILEEIVGEISDETDSDESSVVILKDGSYIFEGKTTLGDLCRIMNIDYYALFAEVDDDIETLAGLALSLKGGFPKKGEEFNYDQLMLKVLEVDSRRVLKVKVSIAE